MFRDGVSEGQFQEVIVLFSFARNLIFESHQQTDYCEEKIRPIFRFIDLRSSLLHIWNYLGLVKRSALGYLIEVLT